VRLERRQGFRPSFSPVYVGAIGQVAAVL